MKDSYQSNPRRVAWVLIVRSVKLLAFGLFVGGQLHGQMLTTTVAPPSPVPFIQSISPVSAAPGGAAFTLTVNGANLVAASQVIWGPTPLVTTFVSKRKLTALVPATLIASAGTGWITVQSPSPGGGNSNTFYFPVQPSVSFVSYAQRSYAAGSNPSNIVQGDFNNDGNLDLAVSNFSDGTISIFLGNEDGTFQKAKSVSVAFTSLFGMAVGDLNHDDNLDLVVGEDSSTGVAVLLGNGDGTFGSPTFIGGGTSLLSPILADINRDGNLDIVCGVYGETGIDVFYGVGDGTFQPPTLIAETVPSISNIAVADMNNDGVLDVVAASWTPGGTPGVFVILARGDGLFFEPVEYGPAGSWNLVLGDFNQDTKIDVVASLEQLGSGFLFYKGIGDGTLAAAQGIGSGSFLSVAAGDLNGDGHLDIVGVDSETSQLAVNLGAGDGTFVADRNVGANIKLAYSALIGNFVRGAGLGIAVPDGVSNLLVFEPTIGLNPSAFNFDSQSSSSTEFTVTNTTSSAMTISSISFTGTNAADFSETDDCPISSSNLAAGGSCSVHVNFTPSSGGVESSVLNVTDNAPGSPQTALITGGSAASLVTLSATSLVFTGQVGNSSANQIVTLTNTGSGALDISGITLIGTNAGDFQETNTCGSVVAPTETCTITVSFEPTLSGTRTALVSIADDAANSPQVIGLSGSAPLVPTATLSLSSIAYPAGTVGSASVARSFTVANSGGTALSISNIVVAGANANDFSQTNNCGSSVAAGSLCTVNVTFTPLAGETRNATVVITDSAQTSPQLVTLTGTGQDFALSITPAAQSITAGETARFQLVVTPQGGFGGTVTLTCTNAPANSTCTASPNVFTPSGAPSTITVAVVTTAMNSMPRLPIDSEPGSLIGYSWLPIGFAAVLLLLECRQRSKILVSSVSCARIVLALSATLFLTALSLAGCGSTSVPTGTSAGTKSGTYNLEITASSDALTHTSQVSISVQ